MKDENLSPILLAIDIGTSGVRVALFDTNGVEIPGGSVRSNRLASGLTDFSTTDARALLAEVVQTIDELYETRLSQIAIRLELIALSCFWHSLVGVDENGDPTTPVLGWADNQASPAAAQLRSRLNEPATHSRTGCRLHPSYWPAKLLRLRNEEPEAFRATTRWLSFAEYLTLNLCGATAASVSMASGTGLLNLRTCEWDEELLAVLDVSLDNLPGIASAHTTFGLTGEYASRWPQLRDARVSPAIGDGATNNIGAGCTSKEKVSLMIGTSGAMRVAFRGDPPPVIPPELWCYRVDRQRIILGGALSDGGGLHHWLRATLLNLDPESTEHELARMEPDAHGLTILPFWAGERSTGWNADARGAILGLSLQTGPIEVLRAAMEAVAYRFALIARVLEKYAPGAEIVVAGNALRASPAWVQILADVLGRPLSLSEGVEASTRGAALLALEAAGKIQSLEESSMRAVAIVHPDIARHALYQAGLQRQQQMYEAIILQNPTGR